MSLQAKGTAWTQLWSAFYSQIDSDFTPDDRLELVLGEPSLLATNLRGLAERCTDSDVSEWKGRLNDDQRGVLSSIERVLARPVEDLWGIFRSLDVTVLVAEHVERDHVPHWMPLSSVPPARVFRALFEIALEGAAVRASFDGPTLYERLRVDAGIMVENPSNWGSDKYRDTICSLSTIEVPGTSFKQPPGAAYLWPRCVEYRTEHAPDFDDDFASWRYLGRVNEVEVESFPSADLNALVVVAGPGFGKTTLVHALAKKTALGGLLPVVLSIPKLADSELPIATYLSERINSEFGVGVDWQAAARAGQLVLFLDGLDEVSSERRVLFLERLKVYRSGHPGVPWLLTVRDASALVPPGGAKVVEIASLRDSDLPRYVEFYRPGEHAIASALLTRVFARPELAQMVRIPIFLALMLVLHLEEKDLRRSDLLDSYLEILFRPSEYKVAQLDGLDTEALRRVVEHAAFEALETDNIGISVRQFELHVKAVDQGLRTDDVRDALVRRGLLRRDGLARLSFPFPIIQEYLASGELLRHHSDQLVQRLSMIVRRPWAQAVQFALERHPTPTAVIEEVLGRPDDVFHTGLRLLGRCLSNGMPASSQHRYMVGERLAELWGGLAWRTNLLVDGIIVDAFSNPLHPLVRARLSERNLIHHGSGRVLAVVRDSELSKEVLEKLLGGRIDSLLNLAEIQSEVDRLGSIAFGMYIRRARCEPRSDAENGAISCLIGHLQRGRVPIEDALSAANDATLALEVRLAARTHAAVPLDYFSENLIRQALAKSGFFSYHAAALAMGNPAVDVRSILRLVKEPSVLAENAPRVLSHLIEYWFAAGLGERVSELLTTKGAAPWMQVLALQHAVTKGQVGAFDELLSRMPTMSIETMADTIVLLGHVPSRSKAQALVAFLSGRDWSAEERLRLASSLITGLMWRVHRPGGASAIDPIPRHPGRTASVSLLKDWIFRTDYEPWDHLRLVVSGVEIGIPDAIDLLRAALEKAMVAPTTERLNDESAAGRALETLQAHGVGASVEELELIAATATYNLCNSAVGLIARAGSMSAVDALLRLYGRVASDAQKALLEALEPLAGRMGLRITMTGGNLVSTPL
ncbi:hypothetical protein [Xanthomonas sp. LMG 12462]|uniref:NACHT domain-containing protein n=1 Tax=Xanthomonas sp. LMG 12462 TaxID=1591134 RepID=UPI001264AB3A|nr:hypothetical protein [Xanthomonas sp. LMG 12462]